MPENIIGDITEGEENGKMVIGAIDREIGAAAMSKTDLIAHPHQE